MKALGCAPAKMILFGEHYVVYGAPAIACAISPLNRIEVRMRRAKNGSLRYSSTVHAADVDRTVAQIEPGTRHPIEAVWNRLRTPAGLDRYRIEARVLDCWPLKGVGNSASLSAAFDAAVRKMRWGRAAKTDVFEDARAADDAAHGRASGVDAAAVSFGGVIEFQKMFGGAARIAPLRWAADPSHRFLLIDTSARSGSKATTKEQVETFARSYRVSGDPTPTERGRIARDYRPIHQAAVSALGRADARGISEAMEDNHALLKKHGVSSKSIEAAVRDARRCGALGAKLTGAGGEGGAVIAYVRKDEAARIAARMANEGWGCHEFRISKRGVHAKMDA